MVVLLNDLKEARERLKADSHNGSRTPRSSAVWLSAAGGDSPEVSSDEPSTAVTPEASRSDSTASPNNAASTSPTAAASPQKRSVGRQLGAPGHGRELTLPEGSTQTHRPSHCIIRGNDLSAEPFHNVATA